MKVVGITYLCEFSAGICKDAGFAAVSDQIEILGKLSVLFAGLPILLTVIRQIYGIYKSEGAMDAMWQEYGMEELEKGCRSCFRPPGSPWRN